MTEFHGHTGPLPEGWSDRPGFDPDKPLVERLVDYGLSRERAEYMVANQEVSRWIEMRCQEKGIYHQRGWFSYARMGSGSG